MGVNKDLEHVLVLPEDDANRELANGFWLEIDWNLQRRMQVLPVAGGWIEVLNLFKAEHLSQMDRFPKRFMVLLIDFDNDSDRMNKAKAAVPSSLVERVFILGAKSEPEDLKKSNLGTYERIGSDMAKNCRDDTDTTWKHDLLWHNASELDRLRERVRQILFP